MPLMLISLSMIVISCTQDDPERDFSASETVKTTTLIQGKEIVYYEDFNLKYTILLDGGRLGINPYKRADGSWDWVWTTDPGKPSKDPVAGIISIGVVNDLSEIKDKCSLGDGESISGWYPDYHAWRTQYNSQVQPNYGYSMCIKTSEGSIKHSRLVIVDYGLDETGSLNTIKVRYQLF